MTHIVRKEKSYKIWALSSNLDGDYIHQFDP